MQRPDHVIAEDVALHLTFHEDGAARLVDVAVEDAEVTLTGQVVDGRHRTYAEEVAAGVPGTRKVHNRIAVRRRGRQAKAAPTAPEEPPMDEPGQRPSPAPGG